MDSKSWWKSKMLWTNATAVVGGVGTYVQTGDSSGLVVAGMGLLNVILRAVTTQPLGK